MGQIDMEGRELLADNLSTSNVTCVGIKNELSESNHEPSTSEEAGMPNQMALKSKYLKMFKTNKLRRARPAELTAAAGQSNGCRRPKARMFKKFKDFFSSTSLKKTLNGLYKSKSRSKMQPGKAAHKFRSSKKAPFCQNTDSCDEPLNTEASSDTTKQFDADEESQGVDQVDSRHAYYTHESKNLVYHDEYIPPSKDYGLDKPALGAEYNESATGYNGIYDENIIFNTEMGKSMKVNIEPC